MRTRRLAPWPLLMLAVIVFASCAENSAATTTQPATTSTQATTTTTTGQPTELFAFVRSLTDGMLVFDPAEFLTGDEAVAAARAAGVIGADEDLPNDFYIQNLDFGDERQLAVADGVEFTLIGFDTSGALADSPVSVGELAALLSGEADSTELYGFIPGDLPMTLSLDGDTVTGGSQTYLP